MCDGDIRLDTHHARSVGSGEDVILLILLLRQIRSHADLESLGNRDLERWMGRQGVTGL